MPQKKLTTQESEKTALARKVVKVIERKARALEISYGEYFVGIAKEKYPKITPPEAEAESEG